MTPRALIAAAEREEVAAYQISRSSGVRMMITCGLPGAVVPSSMVLRMTLAGVSSAHITGSASSAAFIAASNPAFPTLPASRSLARATNPAEIGAPSSASISIAVRSTGTLPSELSNTAAALTFCPYTTPPACPSGRGAPAPAPAGSPDPPPAFRPPPLLHAAAPLPRAQAAVALGLADDPARAERRADEPAPPNRERQGV